MMTNVGALLLAAAATAAAAAVSFLWLYRTRTTRRWKAVLSAYAEREIAHERKQ
jgi:hypothetical protein